ncbi:YraN family protein [Streptomyces avidinii]
MGGTQAIRSGSDGRGGLGNVLSGIAVAIGFALFLGGFVWGAVVYRPYTVPTDSMMPTVRPGDRLLAQRIDGDEVRRGDVVIFTDSLWSDSPMVKRVVGIGGDTVKCCGAGGGLTVNGTALDEPYADTTRPAGGEIDIVARDGDALVVCEVKTRRASGFEHPMAAVRPGKAERLRGLAGRWLADHGGPPPGGVRIDLVGVLLPRRGAPLVEHVRGVA